MFNERRGIPNILLGAAELFGRHPVLLPSFDGQHVNDHKEAKTSGFMNAQAARSRRLPTGRRSNTPEAHYELFRDWQRTQTQSSATALNSLRQQMDVRSCWKAGAT